MLRVVHYLNQFFGQVGGEEQAGIPPRAVEGPVGPGLALQRHLGEAGTLGSTPSIVSAAVDALSEFGVEHIDMMLRPEKLWRIIQGLRPGSGQGLRPGSGQGLRHGSGREGRA